MEVSGQWSVVSCFGLGWHLVQLATDAWITAFPAVESVKSVVFSALGCLYRCTYTVIQKGAAKIYIKISKESWRRAGRGFGPFRPDNGLVRSGEERVPFNLLMVGPFTPLAWHAVLSCKSPGLWASISGNRPNLASTRRLHYATNSILPLPAAPLTTAKAPGASRSRKRTQTAGLVSGLARNRAALSFCRRRSVVRRDHDVPCTRLCYFSHGHLRVAP